MLTVSRSRSYSEDSQPSSPLYQDIPLSEYPRHGRNGAAPFGSAPVTIWPRSDGVHDRRSFRETSAKIRLLVVFSLTVLVFCGIYYVLRGRSWALEELERSTDPFSDQFRQDQSPPSKNFTFPASHQYVSYTGRWLRTASGGANANSTASSLSILFTGPFLYVRLGPLQHQFWENTIPMLVWTISDEGSRTSDKIFTADGEPGEVLELYSADKELENEVDVDTRWRRLDLMVARWDVVIDLAEFIVHSEHSVKPPTWSPPTRLLVIGDSISCGFTNGDPVPLGAYEAWPAVTQRNLLNEQKEISLEVVAYPGTPLVYGMDSLFRWRAEWARYPYDFEGADTLDKTGPSITVLATGTNDWILRGQSNSTSEYIKTLQTFIESLKDQYATTLQDIVVLSPWVHRYVIDTKYYHEPQLEQLVQSLNGMSEGRPRIHHVHTYEWYQKGDTTDGLHPSVTGNMFIAGNFSSWLGEHGLV